MLTGDSPSTVAVLRVSAANIFHSVIEGSRGMCAGSGCTLRVLRVAEDELTNSCCFLLRSVNQCIKITRGVEKQNGGRCGKVVRHVAQRVAFIGLVGPWARLVSACCFAR